MNLNQNQNPVSNLKFGYSKDLISTQQALTERSQNIRFPCVSVSPFNANSFNSINKKYNQQKKLKRSSICSFDSNNDFSDDENVDLKIQKELKQLTKYYQMEIQNDPHLRRKTLLLQNKVTKPTLSRNEIPLPQLKKVPFTCDTNQFIKAKNQDKIIRSSVLDSNFLFQDIEDDNLQPIQQLKTQIDLNKQKKPIEKPSNQIRRKTILSKTNIKKELSDFEDLVLSPSKKSNFNFSKSSKQESYNFQNHTKKSLQKVSQCINNKIQYKRKIQNCKKDQILELINLKEDRDFASKRMKSMTLIRPIKKYETQNQGQNTTRHMNRIE